MTLTVRLDPALETKVDQEAKRLGITKSEFVKDAIERVLGLTNPAALLRAVRSRKPMGDPYASENVSRKMRAKLAIADRCCRRRGLSRIDALKHTV
jgi:RHH-type rel operon transcriptional repressor/antitoxin RelB